jgi:hypothetical protein
MDHRSPNHGQLALCDHPVALPPTVWPTAGASAWQTRPDRYASLGGDPGTTGSAGSSRWWDTRRSVDPAAVSGARECIPSPAQRWRSYARSDYPSRNGVNALAGTASPPSAATSLGQRFGSVIGPRADAAQSFSSAKVMSPSL